MLFLTVILGIFYFKTANAAVLKIKVCIFDQSAKDNCNEWSGPINFEVLGPFNRISQTPVFKHSLTAESLPKILGTSSPAVINLPSTGNTYKFYQIHYISGGPTVSLGETVLLFKIQDLIHTTFNSRKIKESCSYRDGVCNGILTIDDSDVKTVVFIFDIEKNLIPTAEATLVTREKIAKQTRGIAQRGAVLGAAVQKSKETVKEKSAAKTKPSECVYLLEYLKYGRKNNSFEVIKLQSFLKSIEKFDKVNIIGEFDLTTLQAAHKFQQKYKEDVLDPWALPSSTGYVYITTKKKINEIFCGREFPLTEAQKQEIKEYKESILKQNNL